MARAQVEDESLFIVFGTALIPAVGCGEIARALDLRFRQNLLLEHPLGDLEPTVLTGTVAAVVSNDA